MKTFKKKKHNMYWHIYYIIVIIFISGNHMIQIAPQIAKTVIK